MSAPASPPLTPSTPSLGLKLCLLLPVLAYLGSLTYSVVQEASLTFEFTDLSLAVLMVGYTIGVLFVAGNRKRAIGFLFLTVSSLLTLGAVELVMRRLLPSVPPGVPRPPGARQTGIVSEGMPGLSGVEYSYTINSQGLRAPEGRIEDADFRILTIGGSTTECFYVPDQQSWPWALQDKLAERTGKKVLVASAGAGGHNTLHHQHQLRHYEMVPKFDWVIVLCGYNDLGIDEKFVARLTIEKDALTPHQANKAFYRSSALLRLIQRIHELWMRPHTVQQDAQARWVLIEREQRIEHLKLKTIHDLPEEHEQHLAYYHANLLKIIEAARARGVKLLMLTQPTMWRKDLPPDLEKLLTRFNHGYGAESTECLEKLINNYNQVMRELCAEEKIDCIDLAALLPKDTSVFYDDCHFNISGCAKIADILADFFAKKVADDKR